jgi:hypothetical protein
MIFAGVTKNVDKMWKSITLNPWFWFDFFIFERLIMIALNMWVFFLYYFNGFLFFYFLVPKEYKKNCHCDVHIRSL